MEGQIVEEKTLSILELDVNEKLSYVMDAITLTL
jgi:hypothetical protein